MNVNLIKEEYGRKENSMIIAERVRTKVLKIKEAKVTVQEQSSGPPAWWDFELQVAWEDFIVLDKISKDVKATLSTIPGAIDISTSRKPLPFEFNLSLDPSKLSLYDISIPQVAVFLRNVIDGNETTKIYVWDDEIVVKTQYEDNSVNTFDKIKDLKIKNNKGIDVALRDILEQDFNASVFSISRIDQERVVAIYATAKNGTTWAQIKAEFDKKMWLTKKNKLFKFYIKI